MRYFLILLSAFVVFTTPAIAVNPDEMLKDPALEARARNLSVELRCLVCQNQTIDESDAPLAKTLRILLRERLVAGDSDKQAVDYLVNRYGEFVLLKPRFAAHTLVLWLGPFVLLGIGIVVLLKNRRATGSAVAEVALSDQEKQRLKEMMNESKS